MTDSLPSWISVIAAIAANLVIMLVYMGRLTQRVETLQEQQKQTINREVFTTTMNGHADRIRMVEAKIERLAERIK